MKRKYWQAVQAEINTWRRGALPGVAIVIGVIVARLTGSLQFLELVALDKFLRLRPSEPMDERVVIVGITESDIRHTKTYPIPDGEIADLLKRLQTYQPAVIGLDIIRDIPVQPGHAALVSVFRTYKNVIGTEVALSNRSGSTVEPPHALLPEQVGFADTVLDTDGYQRRSLLAALAKKNRQEEYRFSFPLRIAEGYLATQRIKLENGILDPDAMRFGSTELTKVKPNYGGYVGVDAGGDQILLNVRSSSTPFRVLSLAQIMAGQVNPNWIRGKIVLIGVMSFSAKDLANSGAIVGINPGLVYGVEIQAHATSQIVNAVLDGRPLLKVWSQEWEFLWIVMWGLSGISLGRFFRSPWSILLGLGVATVSLIGICYGLIIWGWWVPVVPAFLVLVLNGTGLTAALFYRHEQELRLRLEERQFVIEQTFNAIHSGPVQTLVGILKTAQSQEISSPFLPELQRLRQELQAIYEAVQPEVIEDELHLRMGSAIELALQAPLHELLYKVYCDTLERELPYLKTIKHKIVQFDPLNTRHLRLEHKRGLCRFLEEALCNVGKHAAGATRLTVICTQSGNQQVIQVSDNGEHDNSLTSSRPLPASGKGLGTQLATNLARQLSGEFRRYPNQPKGIVCELRWTVSRRWF